MYEKDSLICTVGFIVLLNRSICDMRRRIPESSILKRTFCLAIQNVLK